MAALPFSFDPSNPTCWRPLPVPAEDRIGREKRAHLGKSLSAKDLAFDCKASALVVIEENPSFSKLLFENLVLGPQILDDFLLLTIDPTR